MDKDMLANELYLMGKGVRDCCETTIGGTPDEIGEILYDIEAMCLDYKYHVLSFLLEKEEDKEYRAVFICKYNFQKILLTKLFNDIKPHSFEYEYMMGTLLGYSAASMEEFLMRKCTDEFASIEKYDSEEEKEEASPIKDQLSEFDKDAWQVLMSLNSDKVQNIDKTNMITDLLYTDTDDSRAKNLQHNLSVVMSDLNRNKQDFSHYIKVLEEYFHVDTKDEETDTSVDKTINEKKLVDVLSELNKYYSRDSKEAPDIKQYVGYVTALYLVLDQKIFPEEYKLSHIKKFIDMTPPQKFLEMRLFVNVESIYYDESLSQEKKIKAINNAIHRYLVSKKKVMEKLEAKREDNTKKKKSDIVIDTIMNGSGGSKERLSIKQYFGRAAGLYSFLNLAASLTPNTLPEDEQLDHIKKFIELVPPKTFPEILIHNNIKSLVNKSLSKEIKISNIKSILHTYLFSKKNLIYREETEQKENTNESVDPFRQTVIKLYDDLRNTNTEKEFVSILNKFLEKDACYVIHKNFKKSLKRVIENKYGKSPTFSHSILHRIKTFLALGL